MKLSVRVLLWALCAVLILLTPFVISSPQILEDARWEIIDALDSESGFLFRTALADEWEDAAPEYELPVDRSPGMKPNPTLFTETGYEDDSISVRLETIEESKRLIWHIAWINIASPTQLRTNFYANSAKKTDEENIRNNKGYGYVTKMAAENNAVIAMNGSAFTRDNNLHTFEVRMGIVRQTKTNNKLDVLIIDENADFHVFVKSEGAGTFAKDTGHQIVNAFMFGPALVKDGEVLSIPNKYANYAPTGYNPRAAIGQVGPLSYVMVIADYVNKRDNEGATLQELADFMGRIGCEQAYNLDGGNSAILVFNDKVINRKAKERDVNDLIYFATAIPEEAWK